MEYTGIINEGEMVVHGPAARGWDILPQGRVKKEVTKRARNKQVLDRALSGIGNGGF